MPSQSTPILGLPYPEGGDAADVPSDVQKLALALDTAVLSSSDPRLTGNLRTANNLSELTATRKLALASLGIAFGTGTFPGNGQSHQQVVIPHGLGATPSAYGGTPVFEGFVKVVSSGPVNITLQFDLVSPAGAGGASVNWSPFQSGSNYFFNWWAFA
jgi:hypothetical protein